MTAKAGYFVLVGFWLALAICVAVGVVLEKAASEWAERALR